MGVFGSKDSGAVERFGNPQGEYKLHIQYCGGWGYKKHVMTLQREIEKMHPKKFEFVLAKDAGVTGNLEVNLSKQGGVDSS